MRYLAHARRAFQFTALAAASILAFHSFHFSPVVTPIIRTARDSLQKLPTEPDNPLAELEVSQALDRPLFNPLRRPFVAPPVEIVEEQVDEPQIEEELPKPRNLKLLGVNISAREQTTVLVQDLDSGAIQWLKKGDLVADWILSDVSESGARFLCREHQSESCIYDLRLYREDVAPELQ